VALRMGATNKLSVTFVGQRGAWLMPPDTEKACPVFKCLWGTEIARFKGRKGSQRVNVRIRCELAPLGVSNCIEELAK